MYVVKCMRGIQKETCRKPRYRNQYLYVRNIGPAVEGLSHCDKRRWMAVSQNSRGCVVNQFRTYYLTSSSEVNLFPSEPFLGDQKWGNRREGGLHCMEGDREPPTWISERVPWLCWPYEALRCRGAEWSHGWACLVVSIWSLDEGWSRFASKAENYKPRFPISSRAPCALAGLFTSVQRCLEIFVHYLVTLSYKPVQTTSLRIRRSMFLRHSVRSQSQIRNRTMPLGI